MGIGGRGGIWRRDLYLCYVIVSVHSCPKKPRGRSVPSAEGKPKSGRTCAPTASFRPKGVSENNLPINHHQNLTHKREPVTMPSMEILHAFLTRLTFSDFFFFPSALCSQEREREALHVIPIRVPRIGGPKRRLPSGPPLVFPGNGRALEHSPPPLCCCLSTGGLPTTIVLSYFPVEAGFCCWLHCTVHYAV